MKCVICGGETKSSHQNIKYRSLPGVELVGVEVQTCSDCGERYVAIPALAELNKVLAQHLIHDPSPLSGAEIRFLRKHLGLATDDFAAAMGVELIDVKEWEKGVMPLLPGEDRLLRLLVAYATPVSDYEVLDELKKLSRKSRRPEKPRDFMPWTHSESGWSSVGIAA